jgi:eukaryotic-like serine/threonine-protein kinase
MQFLEGDTLADRLRKSAMPLSEIFKIGIAVVRWRRTRTKRDLKRGNIMLTQGSAKLMDSGWGNRWACGTQPLELARAFFHRRGHVERAEPLSPLTAAGSIIGTTKYMLLEQIEGKEADAGSDIFPSGAVLYEMATGKRAFQDKTHLSTASSILAKDPDPIWTVQPLAPKALEHIVRTCLAKDPEDRFQDAHDLTLQLHWLTGAGAEPPVAGSAFNARSPKTLWRRHARTVSL